MPTISDTIQTVYAIGGQISSTTATIASGASITSGINLGTGRLVGIITPAGWTTASMSFQASADGTTYYDLEDDGVERTISSSIIIASRFKHFSLSDWLSVQYLKIRSGTSASPVNQGADRIITLVKAN